MTVLFRNSYNMDMRMLHHLAFNVFSRQRVVAHNLLTKRSTRNANARAFFSETPRESSTGYLLDSSLFML